MNAPKRKSEKIKSTIRFARSTRARGTQIANGRLLRSWRWHRTFPGTGPHSAHCGTTNGPRIRCGPSIRRDDNTPTDCRCSRCCTSTPLGLAPHGSWHSLRTGSGSMHYLTDMTRTIYKTEFVATKKCVCVLRCAGMVKVIELLMRSGHISLPAVIRLWEA